MGKQDKLNYLDLGLDWLDKDSIFLNRVGHNDLRIHRGNKEYICDGSIEKRMYKGIPISGENGSLIFLLKDSSIITLPEDENLDLSVDGFNLISLNKTQNSLAARLHRFCNASLSDEHKDIYGFDKVIIPSDLEMVWYAWESVPVSKIYVQGKVDYMDSGNCRD